MCECMTLSKMRMALMQTGCWGRVAEEILVIKYIFFGGQMESKSSKAILLQSCITVGRRQSRYARSPTKGNGAG